MLHCVNVKTVKLVDLTGMHNRGCLSYAYLAHQELETVVDTIMMMILYDY